MIHGCGSRIILLIPNILTILPICIPITIPIAITIPITIHRINQTFRNNMSSS